MPEDFGPKDEWKDESGEPDENEFESIEDWLSQALDQEMIDGLEAMRVKYEVASMGDLALTALLTLLLIEEKEVEGEMLGWFSYAERIGLPKTLGNKRVVGIITTLDRMMRDARGEE